MSESTENTMDSDQRAENVPAAAPVRPESASGQTPRQIESSGQPEATSGGAEDPRHTVSRLTLGGVVLLADAVNDRLQQLEEDADIDEESDQPYSVLIPVDQWDEVLGDPQQKPGRYLTIGMMADGRDTANRGLQRLGKVTARAGRFLDVLLSPITKSRPMRPVRKGFENLEGRGESRINRWIRMGYEEESRSRVVAQTALNQMADQTMDEIVDNQRVQVFIQEFVEAQSLGIVDEAIEEVRERTVSLDIFGERIFRRLFRRAARETLPGPPFGPEAVHRLHTPMPRGWENSLFGYYAGFVSRACAFLVDLVFIAVGISLTGTMISAIVNLLGLQTFYTDLVGIIAFLGATINGFIIVIGYLLLFWLLTGQTPGMLIFGLRVVSKDGGRVTFWRAVGRIIGYVFSIAIFFLGFLWILWDDRRQGWHDKLGGTFVVYAWPAQPDETFLQEQIQSLRR
jgi:uncharacterized RDD family membrane protein YckC